MPAIDGNTITRPIKTSRESHVNIFLVLYMGYMLLMVNTTDIYYWASSGVNSSIASMMVFMLSMTLLTPTRSTRSSTL